jgi:hypothetical protein
MRIRWVVVLVALAGVMSWHIASSSVSPRENTSSTTTFTCCIEEHVDRVHHPGDASGCTGSGKPSTELLPCITGGASFPPHSHADERYMGYCRNSRVQVTMPRVGTKARTYQLSSSRWL